MIRQYCTREEKESHAQAPPSLLGNSWLSSQYWVFVSWCLQDSALLEVRCLLSMARNFPTSLPHHTCGWGIAQALACFLQHCASRFGHELCATWWCLWNALWTGSVFHFDQVNGLWCSKGSDWWADGNLPQLHLNASVELFLLSFLLSSSLIYLGQGDPPSPKRLIESLLFPTLQQKSYVDTTCNLAHTATTTVS